MYLKITVQSATRTVSDLVRTRFEDDNPRGQEELAHEVCQVAETLAWLALGYPEQDFLEAGNPWRELDEQEQEPDWPALVAKPGQVLILTPNELYDLVHETKPKSDEPPV
jgi:hypothetical protein